ncbi:uncharacterized protein F4812DRAFT_468220 [Daldinia caldariorum]|uniref:uncharacterized protein n=1 Tax=Daldinia caldariorum TaxID=326644 RepID=UPI002007467C|nr:uncharacterized protein F4812DRAFT_468220 [Daldinia caldariorum]KAI1464058.1 hypothetical protein F4812DRAFT_468220 [Daldinia caldariorum]
MANKLTDLFSSVQRHSKQPWDLGGTKPPSPKANPKFWIRDDKATTLRQGESFSLIIEREDFSKSRGNYVEISVHKVHWDVEGLESTHLVEGWDGLLVGNKRLFWNGNRSLKFNELSIQSPGDFHIRVAAADYRGPLDNAIVADFYSEVIHRR